VKKVILFIILFLFISSFSYAKTCEECGVGCEIAIKAFDGCNIMYCDYRCYIDEKGEEHWLSSNNCKMTAVYCKKEYEVTKPKEYNEKD
jgi:hypothetical protein